MKKIKKKFERVLRFRGWVALGDTPLPASLKSAKNAFYGYVPF